MSAGRSTAASQVHCKTQKIPSPFFRCTIPCGSSLVLLTVFAAPTYYRSRYKTPLHHHASTNSIVRDRETVAKEGNLRLQLNSNIRRSTRERPPFTRALYVSNPKLMSRAKRFANSGTQKQYVLQIHHGRNGYLTSRQAHKRGTHPATTHPSTCASTESGTKPRRSTLAVSDTGNRLTPQRQAARGSDSLRR